MTELTSLTAPVLQDTNASDFRPSGLSKLQNLYIGATLVTDLSPLAGLAALELLDLSGTAMTEAQVARLKAMLPKLKDPR